MITVAKGAFQLFKIEIRLDVRKYVFCNRLVDKWNSQFHRYAIQDYTCSSVAVTRSFSYLTFQLLDDSSPWRFPLLDISCHWLLHNVYNTRRIH